MGLQDQVLSFPLTYDNGEELLTIMYDSGAQIPVWCSGIDLLMDAYPNAKKTDYHCEIAGFGKDTELSNIYMIPEFCLANDGVKFTISNLIVAELFKPFIGCDLLLSETMFSKTDTHTNRRIKRELNIIFDKRDRPFVCTARMKQKDMVKGISVWEQNAL